MSDIVAELWGFRGQGARPDKRYSVSEWADTFRQLPSSTSAEHGPWRTSRVPYMKDIMDALSPSSPWRTVALMKGSQIAGSEVGYNFIGHVIDVSPAPTLVIMPTLAAAKEASKLRIDPMIASTPQLAAKVSEAKSRDGSNKMLLKEVPGGYLAMAGANSTTDVRSKPICNLMLDEVDDYPVDVGGQGDVAQLAIVRTRNFPRRKIYMVSSPTVAGISKIEAQYEKTQKMRLYVPCPECGGYQVLKWINIKWDKGSPQNAYYACEHCGSTIQNHQKTWMLERYEWRPDVPDYKGDAIGFHLPSFYSPVGWMSWGDIAKQWVEAGRDEQKLKVIKNTVFGETWKPIGEVPDWEKLFNRREKYERNKVPGGGLVLTAGADVQRDYIQVEVVAWGRGSESWSIDYRIFPGNTADLNGAPWKALAAFLDTTFEHESGTMLSIKCLAVDSSDNTQTVYNWCRRYPINRVVPVKGMSSLPVMLGQPKAVDVYLDGKRSKHAIKLFGVGVDLVKSELYGRLRMPTPGPSEVHPAGFCHFPEDYEEEFFRQLVGEQLQTHQVRGRGHVTYEWVKVRDRNEALDCRVYARAATGILQLDKFQFTHWDQVEAAVWGEKRRSRDDTGQSTIPPAKVAPNGRRGRGRQVMSSGVTL